MSSRELIRMLTDAGWTLVRVKGSHHHFAHPDFGHVVTIAHPAKDVKIGTWKSILKQAGIKT